VKNAGKRRDKRTHPSYGMISASRSGSRSGRLFGSSIKDHHATVRLTISEGEVQFDLSKERYHPTGQYIEVEMSAVQWAEMLTTLNWGSGIPCTIRFLRGQGRIEDPPDDETEVERVHNGFSEYTQEISTRYAELTEAVVKALKRSSKKTREEVEKAVTLLHQAIEADMPFAVTQFQRATDKVIAAAKAEVEAFMQNMVNRSGLRVLQNQLDARAMLEGQVEEDDE
jgi:hypothetical protein